MRIWNELPVNGASFIVIGIPDDVDIFTFRLDFDLRPFEKEIHITLNTGDTKKKEVLNMNNTLSTIGHETGFSLYAEGIGDILVKVTYAEGRFVIETTY